MNPFTLNIDNKNDILKALVKVFGEDYASIIEKRFNSIYFVPYVNYEGIGSYYRFLISCKSRELCLKMLKIIGIDLSKYKINSLADEFSDELKDICDKLLGGSYAFESIFHDSPYGFKSFIPKCTADYSRDYIITNQIEFINAVKDPNIDIVTEENYDEFVETQEYKRIESLAIYYSGIYDALLDYMNAYADEIKEYDDYYKEEIARKREIFEKKRVELFYVLEGGLRGKIKQHVDSLETEEEKVKALLSGNVEVTSDIEYFSDEYEAKLSDPTFEEGSKKWIYSNRIRFFRAMGVDVNPWEDDYNELIKREDIKPLIVYSVFANEVTRLRKLYLEEGQKEFILEGRPYKDTLSLFANNEDNRNAVFSLLSKNLVCVNGGYSSRKEFVPIIYYTLRNWQCGCMDYVILHEIVHAVVSVAKKNREHGCGLEPNIDNPEWSPIAHHDKKRKYERLNEVITDFLATEVLEELHRNDIYILDEKMLTLSNIENFNTAGILKNMLRRFYRRYRPYILEASLKGDLSYLTNVIGEDNFEELNEIIDTVDYYVEKGLVDKLKDNKNDDELVIEYRKQYRRLKELLKRMEDTFDERSKSYYGDTFFLKKRFSKN